MSLVRRNTCYVRFIACVLAYRFGMQKSQGLIPRVNKKFQLYFNRNLQYKKINILCGKAESIFTTFVGNKALLKCLLDSFIINIFMLVIPPLASTRLKYLINCPHGADSISKSQHRAKKTSTPPGIEPERC
jgi:hypothetical protein